MIFLLLFFIYHFTNYKMVKMQLIFQLFHKIYEGRFPRAGKNSCPRADFRLPDYKDGLDQIPFKK